MKYFLLFLVIFLFGCEEKPKEIKKEFTPPADGKITKEMAERYVLASKYLNEAISRHQKYIREFIERYKLREDLSELSDSEYCRAHPEVVRGWERIQSRWKEEEKNAYRKAGISEEEFDWIGGSLADTVNIEIQKWVQEQLKSSEKSK